MSLSMPGSSDPAPPPAAAAAAPPAAPSLHSRVEIKDGFLEIKGTSYRIHRIGGKEIDTNAITPDVMNKVNELIEKLEGDNNQIFKGDSQSIKIKTLENNKYSVIHDNKNPQEVQDGANKVKTLCKEIFEGLSKPAAQQPPQGAADPFSSLPAHPAVVISPAAAHPQGAAAVVAPEDEEDEEDDFDLGEVELLRKPDQEEVSKEAFFFYPAAERQDLENGFIKNLANLKKQYTEQLTEELKSKIDGLGIGDISNKDNLEKLQSELKDIQTQMNKKENKSAFDMLQSMDWQLHDLLLKIQPDID